MKSLKVKWVKFRLLMWKNYLLQKRKPLQTIMEILIPILFSALLVMIRSLVVPMVNSNSTLPNILNMDADIKPVLLGETAELQRPPDVLFESRMLDTLDDTLKRDNLKEILYSPKNELLEKIITKLQLYLKGYKLLAVENAEQLEADLIEKQSFVGIEFPDEYRDLKEIPAHFKYSLRFPGELRLMESPMKFNPAIFNWKTNKLFPNLLENPGGPRHDWTATDGAPSGYHREGFLSVMHFIFRAILESRTDLVNNTPENLPLIFLRKFPFPPFVRDFLIFGLQLLLPLFILLSFVYPCINFIKSITNEKEKQLKEAMKIMGLDGWLHWTAWFWRCFIYMFIMVSIVTILFTAKWYGEDNPNAIFTYCQPTILWLFLILYSIATITFCFMLSVFFSKASVAAAVGGLVWFLQYLPYSFVQQSSSRISLTAKIFMSLFSNTAMALGFGVFMEFEGNQEGVQWHNVFDSISPDDDFYLGHVLIMLAVDSILYLLIALYVEKIFPGDYGMPEKWYFPFTLGFWCRNCQDDDEESDDEVMDENDDFEPEPISKKVGIKAQKLRKVFDGKVAVEGLNLNIYENEITALLGHNGAGKTTTMSMLIGMISPTSGTAIINGKDIRKHMDAVRSSLGFCPQHNILFDDFTVREHIKFYSLLKRMSAKEVPKEIERYDKHLKFGDKIDSKAKDLSEGMKRKLSIAIALCGKSKVVLLDEPSGGVDPSASRELWNVLQKEKKNRTILFSSHTMLEVDVLSDRVAIMSDGVLKTVGSPNFLKKRFGAGYQLTCLKDEKCDSAKVTSLIKEYIPGIEKQSEVGAELSYVLEDNEINVLLFEKLFKDLENNAEKLKIEGFGISMTTLEDVFLRVGADNKKEESQDKVEDTKKFDVEEPYKFSDNLTVLEGFRLLLEQFKSQFIKRFLVAKSNWMLLLIQLLIPICYIVMTIIIAKSVAAVEDLPPLELSLNTYKPSRTTFLADKLLIPNSLFQNISQHYAPQFDNFDKKNVKLNEIHSNILLYYLYRYKLKVKRVNNRYLFGAHFGPSSFTVYWNNQPFHAVPIALSLMHNAIMSAYTGKDCSITVTNKPLPYRPETNAYFMNMGMTTGVRLAFDIGFAMAFVASFFVLPYVNERIVKMKHLQFVSGVRSYIYWLAAFAWDFLVFLLITLFMIITLACFQEESLRSFEDLGILLLLLTLFSFAMLPFVYITASFFKNASTGFTKLTVFFILFGVAMFTVVSAMQFDGFNLKFESDLLTWIFMFIPHFSLSKALTNMNQMHVAKKVCDHICNHDDICEAEAQCKKNEACCNLESFSWEDPGIGRNIFYFILSGLVLFCVLFLLEFRILEMIYYLIMAPIKIISDFIKNKFKKKSSNENEGEDEDEDENWQQKDPDVEDEKERINSMLSSEYGDHTLIMKNVSKYYKNFLAVNQLCIGIKPAESFGLLGVNGAGKTSTFKMLTGDIKISNGEAFVNGLSLKMNMKEVHKVTGYCPQFDALIDELTGRETLTLFALSRGIPKSKLNVVISRIASDFNFTKHLDKKVKAYSGGNKRKLSTAVALLGNPVIIYLDEPTTGMDVGSKRNLWNSLSEIRSAGKTIVLTSHSMEECEALCNRFAIMVNGQFKCLGSAQQLKSKFGEGFVLTVKLKRKPSDSSEEDAMISERVQMKEFIEIAFEGAELNEEYYDMLIYNVPSHDTKWSQIFSKMQEIKDDFGVEVFSVAQIGLEQIFLSLTKNQILDQDNAVD